MTSALDAYDAFSRRVLKVTPTETHTFLYDGWNVVREVVRDNATGFVTETRDYYWGRDLSGSLQGAGGVGGLVAYTRNGALRIPVYDHIGNVVAVVDDSGAVVAAYEYDPFGNIVAQSGAEADEVPFRFSTKYFDAETGLYYYGYRFYAPPLGRWINRDPIEEGEGENLYSFCPNNSLSQIDPLGEKSKYVFNDFGDRYENIWDPCLVDNMNVSHQYGVTYSPASVEFVCVESDGMYKPEFTFKGSTETLILEQSHRAWRNSSFRPSDPRVDRKWASSSISKRVSMTKSHERRLRKHARRNFGKAKDKLKKDERQRYRSCTLCSYSARASASQALILYYSNQVRDAAKVEAGDL